MCLPRGARQLVEGGLGIAPPHHESAGPWGSHHHPPAGDSVPGITQGPCSLLTALTLAFDR